MSPEDKPTAATPTAAQRAAAVRALQTEQARAEQEAAEQAEQPAATTPDLSGAAVPPPPGEGDRVPRPGSRTPLRVAIAVVGVIVVVLAAVAVLGDDGDDGDTVAAEDETTTTTEAETTTTTDGGAAPTEAPTSTSTSAAPVPLPPPAGDPMPTLDLRTDDITTLTAQTSDFRRWLYANPDPVAVGLVAEPDSPAQALLTDRTTRLLEAGQVAIFEGYRYEILDAHSHEDVANATWRESYDRYLVYDKATGAVAIELPGAEGVEVDVQWARTPDGVWLLQELTGD